MISSKILLLVQIVKENIPLSWSRKDIETPTFNWIKLPLSGLPWVYSADVPAKYKVEQLYNQLEGKFPNGFLLRGCSTQIANYFNKMGHEIIRSGAEAVVDLDNLDKVSKSVYELVARGNRWGIVKEIPLNQANHIRVSEFIKLTPYGSKPNLNYLFNNTFDSNTRCFVVSSPEDKWFGVLTVSVSGENSCHTEMILRNSNAPVGVMELLLHSVMITYRDEGYKYFSLGEVPFVSPQGMIRADLGTKIKQSAQEQLTFKIGRFLRYAFNYNGLFDFKDKFNPEWRPVYICAAPKLQFRALLDLFCETGYLELSRSELISNIRTYSKLPSN